MEKRLLVEEFISMGKPCQRRCTLWTPASVCTKMVCGDRKSTRLNQSPAMISYAVFCLKKKKGSLWKSLLAWESPARGAAPSGLPRAFVLKWCAGVALNDWIKACEYYGIVPESEEGEKIL